MTLAVGQHAPPFRLPSAQGSEVALEDYRGRSNAILFFAKGMACGFCRQKMSQLARGLPRFRELETEIVMVTPTPLDRGRFYARNFQLPFSYLCDPEYRAFEAYGLTVRPHSLAEHLSVDPLRLDHQWVPQAGFGDLLLARGAAHAVGREGGGKVGSVRDLWVSGRVVIGARHDSEAVGVRVVREALQVPDDPLRLRHIQLAIGPHEVVLRIDVPEYRARHRDRPF